MRIEARGTPNTAPIAPPKPAISKAKPAADKRSFGNCHTPRVPTPKPTSANAGTINKSAMGPPTNPPIRAPCIVARNVGPTEWELWLSLVLAAIAGGPDAYGLVVIAV